MPIPRRDFMKLFGISLGSMLLARCQRVATPEPAIPMTCYEPTAPPRNTPTPTRLTGRGCLRLCWLRFGELAEKTRDGTNLEQDGGGPLSTRLTTEHRAALDELIAGGNLSAPVADLIQEAYAAAVFHIWRSNAPMTCYVTMQVDYTIASADNLVLQSEVLSQISEGSTIPLDTLAKARAALEHDLAFYALTDEEVIELYAKLRAEYDAPGENLPDFTKLTFTLSPEAKAAAEFLLGVLVEK